MGDDHNTTLKELISALRSFSKKRKWTNNYYPAYLAKSIVIESAELLEHFQWTDGSASVSKLKNRKEKEDIAYELIDVLYYLMMLADIMDIDVVSTTKKKLKKLAIKYPEQKK